jgi:hypothetical protein
MSEPATNRFYREPGRTDAERLDWMSQHEACIGWNREGDMCSVWVRGDDECGARLVPVCGNRHFDNHRAAIDAAMTATKIVSA